MRTPKNLTPKEKYEIYIQKLAVKEAYTFEEVGVLLGVGKDFVLDIINKKMMRFKMFGTIKKVPRFEFQRYLRTDLMTIK